MEEFLDTYFNYKMLKRNLKRDIWDRSFRIINKKYEETGADQPLMYLFVCSCMFFVCLCYSIPYILENLVIGKKDYSIYATPEEITERHFRMETLEHGVASNYEFHKGTNSISIKEAKQNALNILKEELSKNNNILKGTITSTKFTNMSEEELLTYVKTGERNKPFMVQRITFGNSINKAIKILFSSSVKHRKIKGKAETYLVFEEESVVDLEKRLQDLFMADIKIKLT